MKLPLSIVYIDWPKVSSFGAGTTGLDVHSLASNVLLVCQSE